MESTYVLRDVRGRRDRDVTHDAAPPTMGWSTRHDADADGRRQ